MLTGPQFAAPLIRLPPPNSDLPGRPSGPKLGGVPAGRAPRRMGQPNELQPQPLRCGRRRHVGRRLRAAGTGRRRSPVPREGGAFDEAAEAFRPHPACPRCGPSRTAKGGRVPAGHRRLGRAERGMRLGIMPGTVFGNRRKDFATRARFVGPMTRNAPVGAAAELCGAARQTAFGRRRRAFATASGCRGGAGSCSGTGCGSEACKADVAGPACLDAVEAGGAWARAPSATGGASRGLYSVELAVSSSVDEFNLLNEENMGKLSGELAETRYPGKLVELVKAADVKRGRTSNHF